MSDEALLLSEEELVDIASAHASDLSSDVRLAIAQAQAAIRLSAERDELKDALEEERTEGLKWNQAHGFTVEALKEAEVARDGLAAKVRSLREALEVLVAAIRQYTTTLKASRANYGSKIALSQKAIEVATALAVADTTLTQTAPAQKEGT